MTSTNHLTNRTGQILLLAAAMIIASGCASSRRSINISPTPPLTLKEGTTLQFIYSNPARTNFFRKAYARAEPGDRQKVRNEIIDDLKGLIDQNYRAYEVALRSDKDVKDLVANLAAMGLTAAATVAGGESTKTILAAIATGVLGVNATVDKTLFKDFGVEAIQYEMQRLRSKKEVSIIQGKAKPVDQYTLNEALNDLVEYYNAGFVTRAIVSLVVETGSKAKDAKDEADTAKKNLEPTTKPTQ